jgi:hypothetical protein
VNFESLFSALVKCKYILILINPRSVEHEHYLTYTTSGSKQLVLGFKKVPIIHEEVASKYGFDATNSILYNNTNLSSALLSVFSRSHGNMINSIITLKNTIYKLSINNLMTAISKITSSGVKL